MGRYLRTTVRRAALALCCLLALASVGCGRGDDRAYSRGSTITVLYPTDERGLGPQYDMPAQFLMFLTLVAVNADGELEGRLARSWEPSSDYRTWTIRLRTDVRWHDGVPVTAHDIAFSVELLSRPDVNYISPGAVSITVLDDSTLTYTSTVQGPLNVYRTYYPKHLLENLDPTEFYDWEFWKHPVGNGPYRYVRHMPKTMMELEANPDYFRGKPAIERVILKFGPTSLAELLSGNVDVLPQVNPMELPKLGEDPRFRTYYMIFPDVGTIHWNHRHPIFGDPRVRRALTLAINRRELLGVLNLPDDLPLFDVIYTKRQWGELPEPLPHDPERAKQLLEEAGWRNTDDDGIRERNGEEFRFTMLVVGSRVREAVYIQDQLRRVGVRMEISTRESPSLVAREMRAGDFEAVIWRLLMVPGTVRSPFAHFGEGSTIGYRNARVVELLDAAEETQDPEKLDALYRELWPLFQADLPVTFLYPMTWTYVAHRRVRGLSTPYRADPVWYMEHLWIEDER